jgi:hypothetical protein
MQKESAKKKSKKNVQKEEPHSGRRKPGQYFTSIEKKGKERKEREERKRKHAESNPQPLCTRDRVHVAVDRRRQPSRA